MPATAGGQSPSCRGAALRVVIRRSPWRCMHLKRDRAAAPLSGGVRPRVGVDLLPVTSRATSPKPEWDRYVLDHPDATVDHLWAWRHVFEGVFGHQTRLSGRAPRSLRRRRAAARAVPVPSVRARRDLAAVSQLRRVCWLTMPRRPWRLSTAASDVGREFRRRPCRAASPAAATGPCALPPAQARSRSAAAGDGGRPVDGDRSQGAQPGAQGPEGRPDGRRRRRGAASTTSIGVFARNMRDLGTPVYPKRLFSRDAAPLRATTRACILVRRGRRDAGRGAIAITFRDTVLVPWASSLREFRHALPEHAAVLVDARAATARRAAGVRLRPFVAGGGTHQFKLQWGAERSAAVSGSIPYLAGRRRCPTTARRTRSFSAAIAVWKRCPLWLTNAVGPHVVRAIP